MSVGPTASPPTENAFAAPVAAVSWRTVPWFVLRTAAVARSLPPLLAARTAAGRCVVRLGCGCAAPCIGCAITWVVFMPLMSPSTDVGLVTGFLRPLGTPLRGRRTVRQFRRATGCGRSPAGLLLTCLQLSIQL